MLASGGIPLTRYIDGIIANRVWVRLTVDGTSYLLDPAFKSYTGTSGLDLEQILGYDRGDLLTAVSKGATLTADSVQNMNESALASQLEQYSANLTYIIATQHPNSTIAEIIGGRRINPVQLTQLPTALAFDTRDEIYW